MKNYFENLKRLKFTSENPKKLCFSGFFRRDFPLRGKSGFTLIELLITIVIFVVLTGVVIINQNSFDNTVLLNNFAYDVALTIRQAQSYGVNVRETFSGKFNTSYGVYFDITTIPNSSNFIFFNDTVNSTGIAPADGIYNGSMTSCPSDDPECIQRYSIKKGMTIQSLCAGTQDSCVTAAKLSILFHRPNLDAIIYADDNTALASDKKSYAKITLVSAGGATSSVVVTDVGQIYVIKK